MNPFTKLASLLITIAFVALGCGGGSGDPVGKALPNKSFTGSKADLDNISTRCSSGSTSLYPAPANFREGVATEDSYDAEGPIMAPGPGGSGASTTITISFTSTGFTVKSGSGTLLDGTWKEAGHDTIEITASGVHVAIDVQINGDKIAFSLANSQINTGCSASGSERATVPDTVPNPRDAADLGHDALPSETESPSTTANDSIDITPDWIKAGTWCYDSGYKSSEGKAVQSFVFKIHKSYVKFFGDQDFQEISLRQSPGTNASEHIFDITYYMGQYFINGQFTVNPDDTISAFYGPMKTSILKWYSAEDVACP